METWRKMGTNDNNILLNLIKSELEDRLELGRLHYQSDIKGFQGDPLDRAIEEALDLIIYLFKEKQRQLEYEGN